MTEKTKAPTLASVFSGVEAFVLKRSQNCEFYMAVPDSVFKVGGRLLRTKRLRKKHRDACIRHFRSIAGALPNLRINDKENDND